MTMTYSASGWCHSCRIALGRPIVEDGRPLGTLMTAVTDFGVNYVSCTVACGSGHGALWGSQLGWSGSGAL